MGLYDERNGNNALVLLHISDERAFLFIFLSSDYL